MLIFGTGVVTGGLLVKHTEGPRNRRPQQHLPGNLRQPQPASPGLMRIEFLRRLERDLDLTADQHEPIDRILKDGQERMRKLMESIEPRRREEYKKTIEEFRQVLTPGQRDRFDALLKQQQQRARELHKGTPPKDRPGPGLPPENRPSTTNS